MLATQKLAIAAHMHVLLRRKTGRVTDTEWMAENLEYALEVVRFARAKADEDGHADLREWADKLESAVLAASPEPRARPLVQTAVQLLKERGGQPPVASPQSAAVPVAERSGAFEASTFRSSGFADSSLEADKARKEPAVPRYVGGIR